MGPGDVGLSSGHGRLHQLSRGSRGRIWQISQLTKSPLCPVAVLYQEKPKQLAFLGDTGKSPLSDGESCHKHSKGPGAPPRVPEPLCWQCHRAEQDCPPAGHPCQRLRECCSSQALAAVPSQSPSPVPPSHLTPGITNERCQGRGSSQHLSQSTAQVGKAISSGKSKSELIPQLQPEAAGREGAGMSCLGITQEQQLQPGESCGLFLTGTCRMQRAPAGDTARADARPSTCKAQISQAGFL